MTQEFNAIMGRFNMMGNVSSNDLYHDYDFVDDVSNKPLKKEKAIEARLLEIKFFRKMKVYTKVPRSQAIGHKVIRIKFVDINKCDDLNPNYRSRLVAK